jgi:hypothetical protein
MFNHEIDERLTAEPITTDQVIDKTIEVIKDRADHDISFLEELRTTINADTTPPQIKDVLMTSVVSMLQRF